MLRVGICGLGNMGANHARILKNMGGVDLVVGADPLLPKFDFPVVKTVEELLTYDLDYVVIAVPTSMHYMVAYQCAMAGVHVLIEKPITQSYASALGLKKLFDNQKLNLCVGHIERYNPVINAIKMFQFDDIISISTVRNGWLEPEKRMPEGVVYDLLVHDIDIVRYITGENYTLLVQHGDLGDNVFIGTGTLETVWTTHCASWLSVKKQRTIRVVTKEFIVQGDLLNKTLTVNEFMHDLSNRKEALVLEHFAFRNRIMFGGGEIISAAEGIEAVNTIARRERL